MTLVPWLVTGLLIGINALYVAAEFSAVAVQKSQLAARAQGGDGRAARLLAVLEDGAQVDRYIAACQIGITLSSLIVGAYGQATFARWLSPWLQGALDLGTTGAQSTAFLVVLLVLTVLQVVLGELVPKSLALQFPEQMALSTYPLTRWSVSVYRGFIWLLNGSGFLLLKPFGVKPGGHQHVHSSQEIQFLLAESHRGGELGPESHRRLERGLRLSARSVRQLMTPRSELYAIEVSTPAAEVMQKLLDSPFSRVPVYEGTLDNVLGAVTMKDVAGSFAARGEALPLGELVRPMPFVPETLGAHRFVRILQEKQNSKAIVVNEYGGVQGIISIEDVLTQLFGDVGDELKHAEVGPERLANGCVRLPGDWTLDEAEPWLGTRWEGHSATVGGHVIARLGRLPALGESVEVDGVEVTVVELGPRAAVRWLVARPWVEPPDTAAADSDPDTAPTVAEESG